MDRFIAIIWNEGRESCRARVDAMCASIAGREARWSKVIDVAGLRVYMRDADRRPALVAQIGDSTAVVIGPLFKRGSEQAGVVRSLDPNEADAILSSEGRALLETFWGSYVAIWRQPDNRQVSVLRDPSGALSCFRTQSDGVTLLCSCVADIASLPGVELSVDWTHLSAFLVTNFVITPRTSIEQIDEVMPGQLMRWTPDGALADLWLWNGPAIAAAPRETDLPKAIGELRETAFACFKAWGKAYDRILVRMSGGLDSSIAAGLLRSASGATITGLHIIGRDHEAFERDLARLAALHAEIPLTEIALGRQTLSQNPDEPLLARPTKQILGRSIDVQVAAMCRDLGVQAVMGGHGGDALFLQRGIASDVLADLIRLKGRPRDIFRVAYEVATLLERSVWGVVGDGFRRAAAPGGLPGEDSIRWATNDSSRVLTPDAITALPTRLLEHPLEGEISSLPPAKAAQVRSILALRDYHPVRGHALEFDAISPFVSQPLIEFALRTPAPLFIHGGRDRALERMALAKFCPEAVARRTAKGFINHHLASLVQQDLAYLRAYILDGELAKHPMMDRTRCEQLLSVDMFRDDGALNMLLSLISVEAWLRSLHHAQSATALH